MLIFTNYIFRFLDRLFSNIQTRWKLYHLNSMSTRMRCDHSQNAYMHESNSTLSWSCRTCMQVVGPAAADTVQPTAEPECRRQAVQECMVLVSVPLKLTMFSYISHSICVAPWQESKPLLCGIAAIDQSLEACCLFWPLNGSGCHIIYNL